jgi:signal transduction histidine kinase
MPDPATHNHLQTPLRPHEFKRRFLLLVLLAWNIPPVFGLLFILFIEVISAQQMAGILSTPLEPAYIIGWLAFAAWYLPRYVRPMADWLAAPDRVDAQQAAACLRAFPLHFWGLFLIYLLLAPASVILAAEHYTDFVATPVIWFRIQLVSLIVSIVVGLPIFFLMLDLFGCALGGIELQRPTITVRTKVFLIGALVPLLIDTMLVQYFWTRTGFFTTETFIIWLTLELLAIGGSLIFVRSFGQSLAPLRALIGRAAPEATVSPLELRALSTDEIGLLTHQYRHLLEALREHGRHLERMVDARTADLARVNRELEAFSYSVSHDLRAPLRSIDGFSRALIEDCAGLLDAAGLGHLERIRRAARKMDQLIDDMLKLARVSRAELKPVQVDLAVVARNVIAELRKHDPRRAVSVDVGAVGTVHGDAGLLTVALENLLENAWKYTGKIAHARIEFGTELRDGRTVYYVKDNGAGFDSRYAEKLFGAFQRLHTETEFPGTGIGLATVRRIISRHGGDVWAEGEVGGGATFYFTLGNVAVPTQIQT